MSYLSKLESFLLDTKLATYANKDANPLKNSRLGSKDYEYTDGNLIYHDTYFGVESFMGEEVVYKDNKPIWGMNYYGQVFSSDFAEEIFNTVLRPALTKVGENGVLPVRGPASFAKDDYEYEFIADGGLDDFSGMEIIRKSGAKVYELSCRGGKIN